jgi:hypothetical protein
MPRILAFLAALLFALGAPTLTYASVVNGYRTAIPQVVIGYAICIVAFALLDSGVSLAGRTTLASICGYLTGMLLCSAIILMGKMIEIDSANAAVNSAIPAMYPLLGTFLIILAAKYFPEIKSQDISWKNIVFLFVAFAGLYGFLRKW